MKTIADFERQWMNLKTRDAAGEDVIEEMYAHCREMSAAVHHKQRRIGLSWAVALVGLATLFAASCQAEETHNIFGGKALRYTLSADSHNQSVTWSIHDQDNNFRDFNLLWDGTLDVPGAIQLDHQTHKHYGEWRWHWTTDDAGAPLLKGWPTLWPADVSVEMEVAPGVTYRFTADGLVLPSGRVLR